MLVRRDALEQVGGLDEDFFLYCEDTDLCAPPARRGPFESATSPAPWPATRAARRRPASELLAAPRAQPRRSTRASTPPRPRWSSRGVRRRARPRHPRARGAVAARSAAAATCTRLSRRRSPRTRAEGGLAMCGIAGAFRHRRWHGAAAVAARAAPDDRPDRSTAVPTTPASSPATAARSAPGGCRIIDVDGGHQPFSTSGSASGPRRTARSTTTRRCAASSRRAATCCAAAATPRCCRISTRSTART